MSEEFLTAENLHKSFNEHKAVNGISFTINEGEIFGLLGPNGAGKTTTIRILSTVLEPDRGDVTIGGHSVRHNADAVRQLLGVCPQELALYADRSALDNLLFFGRMVGLNGREAKSQAAIRCTARCRIASGLFSSSWRATTAAAGPASAAPASLAGL